MEITFGNTITKKTPVYADGELLGALYPKELVTYGLEDGEDVSLETIEQILKETLIPRAKRYAMNVLPIMQDSRICVWWYWVIRIPISDNQESKRQCPSLSFRQQISNNSIKILK